MGEIIVMEEFISYPNANQIYLTCSHCLEQSYNCMPCNSCVYAMYCTEECRREAWTDYHYLECCDIDHYQDLTDPKCMNARQRDKLHALLLARRMLILGMKEPGASGQEPLDYLISEHKRYASIDSKILEN